MRLTVERLSLGYGGHAVIEDVNLEIAAGEMVALVGPNGSGKSTFLRGLARLHRPLRGTVRLEDTDIRTIGSRDFARRVAFLPQAPEFSVDLTVEDLVWRGRYPHQGLLARGSDRDALAVHRALTATGLQPIARRSLGRISGGERQRAWIAMALAQEPRVLLLDEPTSSLDVFHQVELVQLLRDLNATGITIVAAIHDLVLAAEFADRVIAVRGGRVLFDGAAVDVMTPETLRTVFGVPMRVLVCDAPGMPIAIPLHERRR